MYACASSHRRSTRGCRTEGHHRPTTCAARGESPGRRKGEPSAKGYVVFIEPFTASTLALSPAERTISLSERDTPCGVVFFADTVITTVFSPPAGTATKYVPLATSFLITLPPLE